MSYRTTHSEKVFHGKVFDVRIDTVESPDGSQHRLDIVEHGGSVCIIPIDGDQKVWFVRQYRHAVGERILELPAGTLEEDEPPERCAVRECREEVGLEPARLVHLGSAYLAPGYSTEWMHFYLALDLTASPLPGDADEDIQIEAHPWEAVERMTAAGEIRDVKSLAALLLTKSWMEKRKG